MITPTKQIVCSIVSRQLIAAQSPNSCRPIATYFQSVGYQSPTSRRPITDWSPIFRHSCRRPVADWSATEKRIFDRTMVALVAAVFQSHGSRRQVAVHVSPGLNTCFSLNNYWILFRAILLDFYKKYLCLKMDSDASQWVLMVSCPVRVKCHWTRRNQS